MERFLAKFFGFFFDNMSRYYLVFASLFPTKILPAKMRKVILENSKIQTENFAIGSRVRTTCKNSQCASVAISWVTSQEAYPQNERFCSFQSKIVIVFQIFSFCFLRAFLNPKHIFSQNLTQNSRSIPPKTHLKYVLTLFHYWFLRLSLRL